MVVWESEYILRDMHWSLYAKVVVDSERQYTYNHVTQIEPTLEYVMALMPQAMGELKQVMLTDLRFQHNVNFLREGASERAPSP